GEVLQHLVRVHDVERRSGKRQRVHVAGVEGDAVDPGGACRVTRAVEHFGLTVDADDRSRCNPPRDIDGDGPRPAADVEHARPRRERVEEVARGVLRGAPPVRAQDALVVAVCVRVARRAHSGSGAMPAGSKNARNEAMRPSSSNTMWSTIGASTNRSAPWPTCTRRNTRASFPTTIGGAVDRRSRSIWPAPASKNPLMASMPRFTGAPTGSSCTASGANSDNQVLRSLA